MVVPSYNSVETLKRCIGALQMQEYPEFQIIVVNDGSEDATHEYCSDLGDSIVYVVHTDNQGRSAARNSGIACAQHDFVAFIDADCIAHPQWLAQLMVQCIDQGVLGVSGAVIHVADDYIAKRGERVVQNPDASWPMSGSMMYRRSVLDHLGGFAGDYDRYEDKELALRVWKLGRIAKAPQAKVYHQQDGRRWPDFDLVHSSAQWVRLKKSHDLHHDRNNPPPMLFGFVLFPKKYIGLLWRLLALPVITLLAWHSSHRRRARYELRWLLFLIQERWAIWKMAYQEKVFMV